MSEPTQHPVLVYAIPRENADGDEREAARRGCGWAIEMVDCQRILTTGSHRVHALVKIHGMVVVDHETMNNLRTGIGTDVE